MCSRPTVLHNIFLDLFFFNTYFSWSCTRKRTYGLIFFRPISFTIQHADLTHYVIHHSLTRSIVEFSFKKIKKRKKENKEPVITFNLIDWMGSQNSLCKQFMLSGRRPTTTQNLWAAEKCANTTHIKSPTLSCPSSQNPININARLN